MDVIKSFTVDHLTLLPGIYVSRVDKIDGFTFTTFDLRFTRPNFEPVMNTAEIHTIEHLAATFFRMYSSMKEKTMYFGPMGCRTGFYLIMAGDLSVLDVKNEIISCMNYIINYSGEIPGASAKECGNYLDLNLNMAQYCAKGYLKAIK